MLSLKSSCCSHAAALTRLESCEVKCGSCSMRLRLWTLNTGRQSFICSDTGLVRILAFIYDCNRYPRKTTDYTRIRVDPRISFAIIDKKPIFSPGLCLSRWSSGGRCWGSTASASCCSLHTWPRSSPAWWVQRHGCNKMTLMTTYRSNVWYKSLWSCLCNKMEDSWLAESLPWENGNVLPTFKTRNSVQTFFIWFLI